MVIVGGSGNNMGSTLMQLYRLVFLDWIRTARPVADTNNYSDNG